MSELIKDLLNTIKDVPDFPKPGILFKDISPLLKDAKLMKRVIREMAQFVESVGADYIVGAESRGFLFGMPLALELGSSFVPARKKGKLPGAVITQTYDLEYGIDHIEMQKDSVQSGKRYLIVDDVIATGGTAAAIANLIQGNGGIVSGYSFLIELTFLPGRNVLQKISSNSQIHSILPL
jgi:adenine phosphoribosyltransferase